MSEATPSIEFKALAEAVLSGEEDLGHNLAILRAVVGGTEMALSARLSFDPRGEFWRRPERRFIVAYFAKKWPKWPADEEEQALLANFAVRLARRVDRLREEREITYLGVDYDDAGGVEVVLRPLRDAFESLGPVEGWPAIRPSRESSPSASQSLLLFLDSIVRDGFEEYERSLRFSMMWWPALGAKSLDDLEARQRFFWAYRNAVMSSNAYSNAGAQYFGPVIGNTPTDIILASLDHWRRGASTAEAPLMGLGREDPDDQPSDRTHTNIAREIWGFLNLHRAPFYNNRVAAYEVYGANPEAAVLAIGRQCRDWLASRPVETAALARKFDELFPVAKRSNGKPFAEARRARGKSMAALDARLHDELLATAQARLQRLEAVDRAAILLHVTLDRSLYMEDRREPAGSSRAEDNDEDQDYVATDAAPQLSLRGAERVWIYSPGVNARHWDFDRAEGVASIGWDQEGDLLQYPTEDALLEALSENRDADASTPRGAARTCWSFSREIRVGDPIIARKGRSRVVGIGVVTRGYYRVDGAGFVNRVGVRWRWTGNYVIQDKRSLAMQTLVEASRRKALLQELSSLLDDTAVHEQSESEEEVETRQPYTREDALSDLFIPADSVDRMVALLRRKKNLILQGPPGVGKTFVAQRLAYLLMGEQADDRLEMVQFHQAYTYEQFVRGYRPTGDGGFELAGGPLYELTQRAQLDRDNDYVLIIDEINRGNLSKILGEAMVLLEADKRSEKWALRLAYTRGTEDEDEEPFYLPENLYIIGTMNTADRSLAVVDYALRRRFVFVDVEPGFEEQRFGEHLAELPAEFRAKLLRTVTELNRLIENDANLGRGFVIGHSYFCRGDAGTPPPWADDPEGWLLDIYRYEVLPLLHEYWYDDPQRMAQARTILGLSS